MFNNLAQWFEDNDLSNHHFTIAQEPIASSEELEVLQCDDAAYKKRIQGMLNALQLPHDVSNSFVDRSRMDSVVSKAAFIYYFMKIDSDNWISASKLAEVLDQCRVQGSDEYAVVLRGEREVFTSWNPDSMTLTVVLIDLAD